MAYSIKPNNDFVLQNSVQNKNSNELDVQFFTDFLQSPVMADGGIPGDGGGFNLNHTFGQVTVSRSGADHTNYGITNGHGVISINNGVSNSEAFHRLYNQMLLPGVEEPKDGRITKYEMEMGMKITENTWATDEGYGYYRFGFIGPDVSNPTQGIYFEFWRNGELDRNGEYYIDSEPFDTNWMIVRSKNGEFIREDTGVPCVIDNIYQLYISVTRKDVDDAFIEWTIINKTNDTKTTGVISLYTSVKYPYQSTDYMTMNWGCYGIGSGINWPGNPRILVDYIGARIRRGGISREILL